MSDKYDLDGVNDTFSIRNLSVAKIAVATNAQAARFAGPAVANPLAERLTRLPRKIEETHNWSPTERGVNTYIDCVEQEMLQGCKDLPKRLGDRPIGTAPIRNRPSDSSTLFWGLAAIAGGCFWWLATVILKALN